MRKMEVTEEKIPPPPLLDDGAVSDDALLSWWAWSEPAEVPDDDNDPAPCPDCDSGF